MRDSMQLRIVTPARLMLDEPVREVTAPGSAGEFGVLPDHITFLGLLEIGVLSYRTDGGQRQLAVRGGFAEVADNVVTLLVDDAAFPEDIDLTAARHALRAADTELQRLSLADEGFPALDARRRWAQAQIDAASAGR
ncbi:MAG: ATP synthase F1 subunit epsilon [Candidatus Binatia bacterium]